MHLQMAQSDRLVKVLKVSHQTLVKQYSSPRVVKFVQNCQYYICRSFNEGCAIARARANTRPKTIDEAIPERLIARPGAMLDLYIVFSK